MEGAGHVRCPGTRYVLAAGKLPQASAFTCDFHSARKVLKEEERVDVSLAADSVLVLAVRSRRSGINAFAAVVDVSAVSR